MSMLKNLFKPFSKKREPDPDNTRLMLLIEHYIADNQYASYKNVVAELESGNAYLLIPSDSDLGGDFSSWIPSPAGLKVKIGIWNQDGLKASCAFTSEEALFSWAKNPKKYVSFRSQVLLKMCESMGIERVIIDSGLRTMIWLQKTS